MRPPPPTPLYRRRSSHGCTGGCGSCSTRGAGGAAVGWSPACLTGSGRLAFSVAPVVCKADAIGNIMHGVAGSLTHAMCSMEAVPYHGQQLPVDEARAAPVAAYRQVKRVLMQICKGRHAPAAQASIACAGPLSGRCRCYQLCARWKHTLARSAQRHNVYVADDRLPYCMSVCSAGVAGASTDLGSATGE